MGVEHARRRVNGLLALLAQRLGAQQARGSGFLVGDGLTAADFYWTTFSNLLSPVAEDVFDMPGFYRQLGPTLAPYLDAPVADILIEHRDRIARSYLRRPMKF
jgi:glutathione S-transferase